MPTMKQLLYTSKKITVFLDSDILFLEKNTDFTKISQFLKSPFFNKMGQKIVYL